MKKLFVIIVFMSFVHPGNSQMNIEVSYDKSVMLVFNDSLKEDDWNCGDKEMVGVTVKANKVLLQAREPNFPETNLILESIYGKFYAFNLIYNNNPSKFFYTSKDLYSLYENTIVNTTNSKKGKNININSTERIDSIEKMSESSYTLEDTTKKIAESKNYLKRLGARYKKLIVFIGGIWILKDKLYFKVNIKNESSISYQIDYGEFLSKTITKGMKGHSALADRKKIIGIYNEKMGLIINDEDNSIYQRKFTVIQGHTTESFIFFFKKFTVSEDKKLFINFWEKNGDRNIELGISGLEILTAKNKLE